MSLPHRLSAFFSGLAIAAMASVPTTLGAGDRSAAPALTPAPVSVDAAAQAGGIGTGGDADAGTWQMLVLTDVAQIPVPAPSTTTAVDYQSELSALKSAQSRLTTEQRKAITYWSKGGVMRWTEILLELVADSDLPPAPNPDGSYPVPDANNPFADPRFPFANPPYAARAYSYVTVAQYEALKVAWHYKYLYNRPAPTAVDRGVRALLPAKTIPAYPSEEAVLSGVTAEIMKLLFPTAIERITMKAGEQRQAALLSGRATQSDIAAGLAIGQAVAQIIIARAGTDGMRTAGGSPAQWRELENNAIARGEIPWKSQDIPPRPPMLPLFGRVRAWAMTAEDIVRERPGPPPSTSSDLMEREKAEVKRAVGSATREHIGIAQKWADGASSPTPPGHWMFIAMPHIARAQWSEVRNARAFALIGMTVHDAAVACWDTKYFYFNPRPTQLDPEIKTVVGLPNFPAYTSGHSTFSAAAATVLSYLFPQSSASFEADAAEAAISRLYGGIHYRSDIDVGLEHGRKVGGYTVRLAQSDGADKGR